MLSLFGLGLEAIPLHVDDKNMKVHLELGNREQFRIKFLTKNEIFFISKF